MMMMMMTTCPVFSSQTFGPGKTLPFSYLISRLCRLRLSVHSWQRRGRSASGVIYDSGLPELENSIKQQSAFKNGGNSREQIYIWIVGRLNLTRLLDTKARLVDAVASDDSDVLVFGARFGAQTWSGQWVFCASDELPWWARRTLGMRRHRIHRYSKDEMLYNLYVKLPSLMFEQVALSSPFCEG